MKNTNWNASLNRARRAIVTAVVATALSQPLVPAASAQQAAAQIGGLEEVIVTAQKRAQNSQEVGIAISERASFSQLTSSFRFEPA